MCLPSLHFESYIVQFPFDLHPHWAIVRSVYSIVIEDIVSSMFHISSSWASSRTVSNLITISLLNTIGSQIAFKSLHTNLLHSASCETLSIFWTMSIHNFHHSNQLCIHSSSGYLTMMIPCLIVLNHTYVYKCKSADRHIVVVAVLCHHSYRVQKGAFITWAIISH